MTFYDYNHPSPLESIARRLDADPDYRVLRRLPHAEELWVRSKSFRERTTTIGVLDTETTGLDPQRHELIEVALAKLVVAEKGDLVDVRPAVSWLEEPAEPLTPEIEALTGLSDAELAGQCFDEPEIGRALADVDVLVSHNARFDRAFLTGRLPWLTQPWTCSAREVDWPGLGLGYGRGLSAVLHAAGFFLPDAHRAAPDAWALAILLASPAPDGRVIAAHLLNVARRPSARVYAERAPFDVKDALKVAGYRWCAARRCWWWEGEPERAAHESAWLRALHPRIEPLTRPVDWYNRHIG